MDVSFEYALLGATNDSDFTPVSALSIKNTLGITFNTTELANGTYTNLWELPATLDTTKNYVLRMNVTNTMMTQASTDIYQNTHLRYLFTSEVASADAELPVALNNPATPGTGNVVITRVPAEATVKIYTVTGALIQTLTPRTTGVGVFEWNLMNANNEYVKPGVYIVHCAVANTGYSKSIKVVVAR